MPSGARAVGLVMVSSKRGQVAVQVESRSKLTTRWESVGENCSYRPWLCRNNISGLFESTGLVLSGLKSLDKLQSLVRADVHYGPRADLLIANAHRISIQVRWLLVYATLTFA